METAHVEASGGESMIPTTQGTGCERIYAVLFDDVNEDVVAQFAKEFSANYQLTENLFLVRTSSLAEDVAVAARIKGDERAVNGVVFKLKKSYAGYYRRTLWDWLGDEE